ncbi:MAG: hypothetical protein MOB07_25240 [Acidobacteria bacterium]|nr:hypothetical protein [Acidobacteriota bacterium]
MFTLIKFIMGMVAVAFLVAPAVRSSQQEEKKNVAANPSPLPPTQWSVQAQSSNQPSEKGEVNGWTPNTQMDRGMERVERVIDPSDPSNHALKVFCDLAPKREEKGEVLCSLRPEGGQRTSLTTNFQGSTIRYRAFVGTGGLGSQEAPNGFQIILKSRPGAKNYYSPWVNIPEERSWFWVSATPPVGSWVDSEFDVSRVFSVGAKIGLSGEAVSGFRGEILIDDFEVIGPDGKTIAKWGFEPQKCREQP